MTFSTLPFFVFLPIVLLGLYLIKKRDAQHIFLLFSSYFFYAWWDVRFLFLMILVTAISWGFALWISHKPQAANRICALGTAMMLGILCLFKYFNFFTESFCDLFGIENRALISVVLPIGISFYTFQAISYLIDVRRGTVKADRSFVHISLYISFFAQLVAGPIVRSSDFLPQLNDPIRITKANLYEGAQIFLFGYAKKKVLADRLGAFVTAVYTLPGEYGSFTLWLAVIAYSVQIYFDFSGYSDMAIGCAKMMGYTLTRNFNAPFLARNPSEFWRRWHISLSDWIRDYIYFPLGGSRVKLPRACFNLIVTMLLAGLWHGASWNYVIWGGIHGVLQALHRLYRKAVPKKETMPKNVLASFATSMTVALALVIFRCPDLSVAGSIFKGLFLPQGGIFYPYIFAFIGIAATVLCHLLARKHKGDAYYPIIRRTDPPGIAALTLITLAILLLSYNGEAPFIYFQF